MYRAASVGICTRRAGHGEFTTVATVSCGCLDAPIDSDPVEFDIVRRSDLAVGKAASNGIVGQNTTATFTITASNAGPHPATGVQVVDDLPAGLVYSSHVATIGTFDPSTNVWSIGELPVGGSETLTLIVVATQTGDLVNSVVITSDSQDLDSSNDAATAPIRVEELRVPSVGQNSTRGVPLGLGLIATGLILLVVVRRRRAPLIATE